MGGGTYIFTPSPISGEGWGGSLYQLPFAFSPSPFTGEGWGGGFFITLPLAPSRNGRGN